MAFDDDDAGRRCFDAVAAELARRRAAAVLRTRWPSGQGDACDVVEKIGLAALHDAVLDFVAAEVAA